MTNSQQAIFSGRILVLVCLWCAKNNHILNFVWTMTGLLVLYHFVLNMHYCQIKYIDLAINIFEERASSIQQYTLDKNVKDKG